MISPPSTPKTVKPRMRSLFLRRIGCDRLAWRINDTWFAWSGPVTAATGGNIAAYYRIQGPHVVIEYAPQAMGGDPSLHVHTMYRDPTNDYGRALIPK